MSSQSTIKRQLLIRADGDQQTGLGHLYRCISLAYMLQDDFVITFMMKYCPENILKEITADGFNARMITVDDDFYSYLTSESVVVLDGYKFGLLHQQEIAMRKVAGIVCIDDMYDRKFACDLIINHAPGVKQGYYNADLTTKFALGPDYALLRPLFLEAASKKESQTKSKELFICFGGSDPRDKTSLAVETALTATEFQRINVVAGAAYPYFDKLKNRFSSSDRVVLYQSLNQNNMLRLMEESSVAIVPSSGILFEVLAAGCKAISGVYVDNQKKVYAGFKELNAIVEAGDFSRSDMERALLESEGFTPPNIIDGNSAERIRNLFKQI
ncbi:MAG: UDP-2,4-diacetamido-2,4,6-trideoxy-beta-L-altropyranose hydrolase [Balneolaceae bacterium]|nr:MAG: UDP-2,4-diacetamido-2,4,6-trideoxy-beta-L-altropyranose hydrolase [Balneolaceae bacterium]